MSKPNDETDNQETETQRSLPAHIRERNRSVATREASRLARPDRPPVQDLPHASRQKSAVSSTPSGVGSFKRKVNDSDASSEQWCGPFSVARQMIAEREDAKKRREDEQEEKNVAQHPLDAIMHLTELENKRKANPSMTWKGKVVEDKDATGKKQNLYYKRQKRFKQQSATSVEPGLRLGTIPSLFDICVKFIVDNFESVESLGIMVDSGIRREICEQLVSTGKMDGAAFDTLAEVGIETLEIIDCTQVTEDQMVEALDQLMPSGLRALLLTHAGRCFGSKTVDAIVKSPSNDLFAVSLSGAYLLKDVDAAKIVASAAKLSSIELKACPLIGLEFCKSITSHFSSKVDNSLLLELSLQDVRLSKDHLKELTKGDALRKLKSLSLRQMEAFDDSILFSILDATGGNLEGIDLTNNTNVTDETLSSIRRCNSKGNLRSLQLGGIKNFTAAGLEAFFTFGIPGLPNPPSLRTLDLSNGDFESVNEAVVNLAITASALKQTAGTIDSSISAHRTELSALGGLVMLDMSGSSLSDKNMESLSALCSTTLKELQINFCPHVSDKGLGYLVSKCGSQLSSIHIWGNAQVSDVFLDGHDRLGSGLVIEGAWMKQSGGRGSKR